MTKKPELEKLEIYDVTPRDGAQGVGINFTTDDKLWIVEQDDERGIHGVEAGYPLSNEASRAVFEELRKMKLQFTNYAAFGMTRKKNAAPDHDEGLHALVESKAPWITVVGKASRFQVEEILQTTPKTNRTLINDSLAFLRSEAHPSRLIFDAEHFFDGFNQDPKYALSCLEAAVNGDADTLVLCDTNGGSFPEEIVEAVKTVRKEFADLLIGIHAHNDRGLAVANTLAAVDAGAGHVQGVWNGYGERAGNADLFSVLVNLKHKGYEVPDTSTFTTFSRQVDERARQYPNPRLPIVGSYAFTHKGGMHGSGMSRHRNAYQFMDPKEVGNESKILGSQQAGRAIVKSLVSESRAIPEPIKEQILGDTKMQGVIQKAIEEHDASGGSYELAPASLELLMLKAVDAFTPKINDRRSVIIDELGGLTQATIKITINGSDEEILEVAESDDGAVDALTIALRKALNSHFPILQNFRLIDYKLKKLPGTEGTRSPVQVLADFTDGEHIWTTTHIDRDSNVAGWQSVKDAIEYMLLCNGHHDE